MGIRQPHRLFLITHPRTASNLLVRILALNDQPDVTRHQPGAFGGGYFFGPASRLEVELGLREKHIEDWSEEHRKQIIERLQGCFDNLENYTQSAQTDGKIAFVKEHAVFLIEPTARRVYGRGSTQEHPWTVKVPSRYGPELTRSRLNETLFPDEYLRDWLPTFLIRHPALVFPSQYRVMKDIKLIDLEREHTFQCDVMMTFRYTRSLYDYWSVQFGKSGVDIDGDNIWPIVLEADDVMLKPEVVLKFTKLAGLDPTKLKFEWEPVTNDLGQNNLPSDIGRRMLSTLNESSGVLLEKTSTNIDIGMEAKTWREEFGEKIGRHVEKLVRAAMPDYEYMKARSLRA